MSANDFDLDLGDDLGDVMDEGDTNVAIPAAPPPAKRTAAAVAAPQQDDEESFGNSVAAMAADIPVQLVASLGRKTLSLKDLLQVQPGQVLDLQQPVSTRVDLVANGKLFAKGELVDIDGQMGVRIVQLVR